MSGIGPVQLGILQALVRTPMLDAKTLGVLIHQQTVEQTTAGELHSIRRALAGLAREGLIEIAGTRFATKLWKATEAGKEFTVSRGGQRQPRRARGLTVVK